MDLDITLQEGKVRDALKFLSDQGSSRYTAIFSFQNTRLSNAFLYDREQPQVERIETDMGIEESYCVFVQQSANNFIVYDSKTDARVDGHSKQPVFRSYCGVPILNDDGSLWGTLCYFDPEPNRVTPDQVDLLVRTAKLLKNGPALAA